MHFTASTADAPAPPGPPINAPTAPAFVSVALATIALALPMGKPVIDELRLNARY